MHGKIVPLNGLGLDEVVELVLVEIFFLNKFGPTTIIKFDIYKFLSDQVFNQDPKFSYIRIFISLN